MSSTIILLVYGLLINKSAKIRITSYKEICDQDDFHSESIQTDFEPGTIKSIKEYPPNISHEGSMYFNEYIKKTMIFLIISKKTRIGKRKRRGKIFSSILSSILNPFLYTSRI